MGNCIIVIGNFICPVLRVVGPFDWEGDAEKWLAENAVYEGYSYQIVDIERP